MHENNFTTSVQGINLTVFAFNLRVAADRLAAAWMKSVFLA